MGIEKDFQLSLQTVIQGISGIDSDSVVINDWDVKNKSFDKSPYVIIETANDYDMDWQDAVCTTTRFVVPIVILVHFTGWKDAFDKMRDTRHDIVYTLSNNPRMNGAEIMAVNNTGRIIELYSPYISEDQIHESLPEFVSQQLSCVVVKVE